MYLFGCMRRSVIEYDYDSDMEAHVKRSRAAKDKAATKSKTAEKTMVTLERTHPSSFAITHEGKL